ncbi:MAG: TRAP transporter substrate-binding protein [Deltaproteobacteria bacterium]|nr:TRAP transporter substrate-binding protein [Deltaproteobacteria bacterium]MBW2138661.1 TRAP transporter substrate-binding protein [Deltaproteobacteria bacterium]
MKKAVFRLACGVFFVLVSVMVSNLTSLAADKYELRYASEYPDKHPTVKNAILPWIEEVKRLSKGRLVIHFFNPNAIAPSRKVYDALVAGSIDMTGSPCHWVHGKFPLNTVIQTPLIFNGAEAASLTTWDMYNKYPEWRNEFKDIKVLWQWGSATFNLHTVKKMVRTLEDLKGLKIIGINPQIREILKRLGANPIPMTPQDSYLALERGMAAGMAFPIAPCRAFKITDVAKYHTIVDLMCDPFYGAINSKKWNSLPADLKKILEDTTGRKLAQACGRTLDEGSINDVNWMKGQGHKFYVLPAKEKERWFRKISDIHEKWVKDMEKKGYRNAGKIHDDVLETGKYYSKITHGGYKE